MKSTNRTWRILTPISVLTGLVILGPALAKEAELESRLQSHIEHLAAAELEGRLTGSEGSRKAAAYIADELEQLGALPLPGVDSLLLSYDFTAGTRDAGSSIVVRRQGDAPSEETFSTVKEVQALSFSDSGSVEGEVVFAGYGLSVPESADFGYDSYATLDVDGKIVLALRYFPEDVDQTTRATLARYSGLRYKALTAREHGAKALILVTGPNSPNAGQTIPMTFDTAISGSGIVAASVSGDVAQALFAAAGMSLEEAQTALDDGNPHVAGFPLKGASVELEVAVEREHRVGQNVVAALPGEGGEEDDSWILLGAHFDHLGHGRHGNSLARGDEVGSIHYGADDNASGVAAVLEVARSLAALESQGKKRRIAVALWSGEELGLLGSAAFLKGKSLPSDKIAAYLNFDMVGRARNNRLSLQAVGSSEAWPGLIERSNVPVGFDIELQEDPYLPTDSASFNGLQVPTLNFFTGSHEDYHRPSDLPQKINYEDLGRVVKLAQLLVRKLVDLEDAPAFVTVARHAQAGGDRDTVRAYTGTIPDYTTDAEGLLLGGVMEGGPAQQAGLEGGDLIVQFGDQKIANIYDYTYALDAVKIDEPIKVVYIRDGERRETTLTPRARP